MKTQDFYKNSGFHNQVFFGFVAQGYCYYAQVANKHHLCRPVEKVSAVRAAAPGGQLRMCSNPNEKTHSQDAFPLGQWLTF